MFPHDKKIITIDQLTYHDKMTSPAPDSVLPLVSSSHELITTYTELSPIQFKPTTILGTFPWDLPVIDEIYPNIGAPVCMMTSSNTPKLKN